MKPIRDAVLNCIYDAADDDLKLIDALKTLIENEGKQVYAIFFNLTTHLDLEPAIAEKCWKAVLKHRRKLIAMLGRNVNFRTVLCDYFCSMDKFLKNPVVVELHLFEEQLNSLKHDSLTGLYSRSLFEEALPREIARARRYETELSLLFLDMDDFKNINDKFGHLIGDMVLRDVGKIIKNEIRAEDSAARYGGEEITIILPETGKVEALIMAERIRKKVESLSLAYENKNIQPTLSGGLASYPVDAQTGVDLLKYADNALYYAKESGKNSIAVYSHNRRRYIRVHFLARIQVRQIEGGKAGNFFDALGRNLSAAGILFESDTFFEIGSRIEVRMPIPSRNDFFVVIGTVVRVEIFDSGCYEIGASFLEMECGAKSEISRYLTERLESKGA